MSKIERYTRGVDGLLVQYDEASSSSNSGASNTGSSNSGSSLFTGITAATSDSSGDWLVSRVLPVTRPIHGWFGYPHGRPGLAHNMFHNVEPCHIMVGVLIGCLP